jgi:hypothetical protein
VLSLIAGGALLVQHPSANYPVETASVLAEPGQPTQHPTGLASCLSPFNRLTGGKIQVSSLLGSSPPPALLQPVLVARAACSGATNGREHAVEALAVGGVILAGLSFLPRRRALARSGFALRYRDRRLNGTKIILCGAVSGANATFR